MTELLTNPVFLSLAIFAARILDVSLGTVRTILVFRSHPYLAACIGFVEVTIWILAVRKVLSDLSAWHAIVAFAGGFAAGNVVGIWLEAKLALGMELLRAVSSSRNVDLAAALRQAGYFVVELAAEDNDGGPVEVIYIVEKRRRVASLLRLIERVDPNALCTLSDVKRHTTLAMAPLARHGGIGTFVKKK